VYVVGQADNLRSTTTFSAPAGCGTIVLLVRCLRTNRLDIGSGLEGTITNINISTSAVSFFGPHAAINQPKGMDMTGYVSENGETDIDQEVTTAAGNKKTPPLAER